MDSDPKTNPTQVKSVTIEHNQFKLQSAISDRGYDLLRSPVIAALQDWINDYFNAWQLIKGQNPSE